MEERLIASQIAVPADRQAAEVAQPSKRPFHFPASAIASQFATILCRWFFSAATVRTNQFNPTMTPTRTQRITIRSTIINQPFGLVFGTSRPPARDLDLGQSGFDERHFVGRRRVEVGCQRNSLAACHHHPLCTLAAFCFSDAGPPFLAGAKLPSAKHSSQSNRWSASSSASRVRQAFNQTPASSHASNRRRQVEYEGYSRGRSCQRAPDRRTHKIPSKQGRLDTGLRPPLEEDLGRGSNGAILSHCSSLSRGLAMSESFRPTVNHNPSHGANL